MNVYRTLLSFSYRFLLTAGIVIFIFQQHATAQDIRIQHEPLTCASPGIPVIVQFKVTAETPLHEARLYFKTHEASDYYYVQAISQEPDLYEAILPGADEEIEAIDYLLLVVEQEQQAVKTPVFSVKLTDDAECPQPEEGDAELLPEIFAEHDITPELGFSGESLVWSLDEEQRGTAYLDSADEIDVNASSAAKRSSLIGDTFQKLPGGRKTAIGAGLGTAALVAVLASRGDDTKKSIWDDIDGNIADNVTASILKTPDIETTCGTIVTNQLFVTNSTAADIILGTIDYEIRLTQDKPQGSCQAGRMGAFAPNLATVVPPGAPILIREWTNEVNPCSGCPYISAECEWESRYIVHTSAGSALTYAIFTSQGDLCGTSAAKATRQGRLKCGDFEP